jgi:hypothetical protein
MRTCGLKWIVCSCSSLCVTPLYLFHPLYPLYPSPPLPTLAPSVGSCPIATGVASCTPMYTGCPLLRSVIRANCLLFLLHAVLLWLQHEADKRHRDPCCSITCPVFLWQPA